MKLIASWWFMMNPRRYPISLVYMLQSVEYSGSKFIKWYWQVDDFRQVMYRRQLERTTPAKMLLIFSLLINITVVVVILILMFSADDGFVLPLLASLALFTAAPLIEAHLLAVAMPVFNLLLVKPRRRRQFDQAQAIFANHTGKKIAVVGSYGKTTMKELLKTVLGEGLKVAATEENLNTQIAHARFADKLSGEEEVLIIEFGEYQIDDVANMSDMTQPEYAVITGLNESHMDNFGSLETTGKSLFAVTDRLKPRNVFVSSMDPDLKPFSKSKFNKFTDKKVLGWKISDVKGDIKGTSFKMTKGKKTIHANSQLLGQHSVAPLALVAGLADKFKVSIKNIEAGLAKTKAFEHRLQPQKLPGDIMILDDTYNGSIDGVRAALEFIDGIEAGRKIYITPGLVEQGEMTEAIHNEVGRLVAGVADQVYLMRNSVTDMIGAGLGEAGFEGDIFVVDKPLEFYQNLEAITKSGDLVLMQNDWTDNYL